MIAGGWSPYMDDISIRINEPAAITQAAKHGFGTRPAFYLNIEKATVKSGVGTKANPFTLTSGQSSNLNQIYVKIGSRNVEFNNSYGFPFVDSASRTQVTLRITMESYGAIVDFDSKTSTAIVTKNGVEVRVPIGQLYIFKNGEKISIDTSAIIKNSRTYLPVRAVVEALAGKVNWDGVTKTVIIEDLSQ